RRHRPPAARTATFRCSARRPHGAPGALGGAGPLWWMMGRMARLLVVEHDADCPAGMLGEWASASALPVTSVRLHPGGALPARPACDAAVLLGSEHTAYDNALPWLRAELAFVERLLAGGVPVLGICFGGQLLARALGGRLYRLPAPELGWAQLSTV